MSHLAQPRPTCHVDVLDRVFYSDPHPVYDWLRHERPIFWDEEHDLWVLSRHADVTYVSTHPELFCSSQGIRPIGSLDLSLAGLDGARHVQLRRLVSKGFAPRMIRAMEPRIRQVVSEVLDRIDGRDRCDFLAEVAVPVPLIVIAELMGLAVDDREKLWRWTDAMMGGEGRTDPDDPKLLAATEAFAEYVEYINFAIEERRSGRHTGEDLISVLVAASDEGVLSTSDAGNDELIMFLVLLVVAGNETTRNAAAGGMWAFSRFPEQWERLASSPELLDTLPDEIVRFVSPVISFCRTATEDAEVRGQHVRKGEKVLMLYQSANRDEDVFEDPHALRIDRSPNPHLGFGVGPHVCLGMNLAKLEIRVLYEELSRRFPDMAVEPGFTPTYEENLLVHGMRSLPVRLTAS